jgi:hypothetical protein
MGIRKSLGKNKKSKNPTAAVAVRREEARRKAAADRGRRRPRGAR